MRERIGSYRIDRILGEGGMGLVYKARHDSLGRDAAIKALLPSDAGDATLRQRLLREAQAQARLQHPNVVTVYDLIEEKGELFIAMELVEGGTLEAALERRPQRRMLLGEALPLFEQVLDALEYVHGEGIIHRDVKPSNVMLCDGQVKLADFGIALLTETPRLTASMRPVGSPQYMSPEQLEAKSIDHRTDIYSAALVLYRMLAGQPAFEPKEYLAQVHDRMVGPVELRTLMPELPPGLCAAVAIALCYDREQRFPSIAAFRDAFRDGAAGFIVLGPQAAESTMVAGETITEPLGITSEPEPRRANAIVWIIIAGTFAAALSVVVGQSDRQAFPVQAPSQKLTVIAPSPASVIVESPDPPVVPPAPKAPPVTDTRKPSVTPPQPVTPAEDEEGTRRRELDALRQAIQRGLERAEAQLAAGYFSAALEETDRIAEMAQRRPADLWQERDRIAALRDRVISAQVADRTRKAQDALWESRIAEVEEDLRAGRWPEAERFAAGIAKDARAPQPIVVRATALLQQAREGRKNAFRDTQLGPTTNTIRKPSSPPGNHR